MQVAQSQSILNLPFPNFRPETQVDLPVYADSEDFRLSPSEVFSSLQNLDWSFHEEETGFLAHDIHPYPAKFIPQIPGTLISRLSARGELVLDPFGGSGTTALEAVRLGRRAISLDANPLSALIGRAKTAYVDRSAALELHAVRAALAAELQALPADPNELIARYAQNAPVIPNRGKWFADSAFGELCLIKARIKKLETDVAQVIARVALSRMVIRASFQDSETRYKSVPRLVPVGETLRRYLKEFRAVMESVCENEAITRYGICEFLCGNVLDLSPGKISDGSVDLIVTSPPYGNATDYHLYHRFRLLWLGFDPVKLGHIEIGSHLKHQREASGFNSYFEDLCNAVEVMARALRPGRYAALVLGDSVYQGETYDPAESLAAIADRLGFDTSCIIERPVHATKRSFVQAARRATSERILVMRKQIHGNRIVLSPPPYKLWLYECSLRLREIGSSPSGIRPDPTGPLVVSSNPVGIGSFRRLAFTHSISGQGLASEPTWQAALENGGAANVSARKDPKYVTHGLHPYKGKFYPQLAKALLNLAGAQEGAILLDPFCGSGTTMLEGYLNGFTSFGCDMHPLAAKIARAKTEILEAEPDVLSAAVVGLQEVLASAPLRFPEDFSEFSASCIDEMERWFAAPVIAKMNWLLKQIRNISAGAIRDFLEVIVSSLVRDISQQEPTDLRIRYRKEQLRDAKVLELFGEQLAVQFSRVEKFWRVRGRAPVAFRRGRVVQGDNRMWITFQELGLSPGSVDFVLTSPPYATALPYIDTDRLSLLTLFGLSSAERRPLEGGLIGSREISLRERRRVESLPTGSAGLPTGSCKFLDRLRGLVSKDPDAGFRKQNMPALVTRYLLDMAKALENVYRVCKAGAESMIVIGDNRTTLGGKSIRIPTIDLVEEIAVGAGFSPVERINIAVTTENLVHQKNAITENVVLRLRKSNEKTERFRANQSA